jgi:DNA polymerase III sliding clamp (beta) subunit (PCNA family)
MILKLEKNVLIKTLQKVLPTVSDSRMIPIYQCFCFKDNKVSSYDGRAGTTTTCNLEDADFAIEASRFYKIVQAMKGELELQISDEKLIIKSGTNKTTLNVFPTRAFPNIIPAELETYCEAENFAAGLKALQFCICMNPMKQALLGVSACMDHLYSSDGNRIARFKLSKPAVKPITFPSKAVEHIVKLGQPDRIFHANNIVGAFWKETKTVYATQTLAYSFPVNTVEDMIASMRGDFALFPEDMASAVSRVKLLASSDETDIIVGYNGQVLVISATTAEVGEAVEVLPWDYSTPFNFHIKPHYLEQALDRTRRVDLSDVVNGHKRSLRFSEDGFEHLCGLMG